MIGSPRVDDEIIYSWCFNSVEYFDSTPSAAIIILDEDLESFSSLRSQQVVVVLFLFIDIWYVDFFIKTLVIIVIALVLM